MDYYGSPLAPRSSGLLIIIIMIVIFLLCREFFCWYWKINERRDILNSIKNQLNEISEKLGNTPEMKEFADTETSKQKK